LLTLPTEAGQQDRAQLAAAAVEDKYGSWQQALKLTELVLARDPANVEALNLWAFVAAEHDYELPLALSRAQAALSFDAGSAAIMDTLGWVLFKQKQLDKAAPFLEGAAQFEPNDPEILAHVAALEAERGRGTVAAEKVRLALTLSPEPRLKGKLEALLQRLAKATVRKLEPANPPGLDDRQASQCIHRQKKTCAV
jgi:predicted Zn-dependent protease